jgi:hypothetical protein
LRHSSRWLASASCAGALALTFCHRVAPADSAPEARRPSAAKPGGPPGKAGKPDGASKMRRPSVSPSFDDVKYGFFPSPCSPQFEPTEPDGIKIAAPATFNFGAPAKGGAPAKLPFCVTLRFNSYYVTRFDQIFRVLQVVIVDDGSGAVMSGSIWRDRHYLPEPPPDIPREQLEKSISTEYKTVDLLEFFRLPKKKARYQVYALLENHKSNVITIETLPE